MNTIRNFYKELRDSGINFTGAILIILFSPFAWIYTKVKYDILKIEEEEKELPIEPPKKE